jgi:hypothetical protein
MAVAMKSSLSKDIISYNLVKVYRRIGRTYGLQLGGTVLKITTSDLMKRFIIFFRPQQPFPNTYQIFIYNLSSILRHICSRQEL